MDDIKITTKCEECKHFEIIYGVKTCGKGHIFLDKNVKGCYGGEKE